MNNPAHLPTADQLCHQTRAVAGKLLARADGQFERAVGSEIVADVARLERVVSGAVNRIRVGAAAAEEFAPCIRGLHVANAGQPANRGLHLQGVIVRIAEETVEDETDANINEISNEPWRNRTSNLLIKSRIQRRVEIC